MQTKNSATSAYSAVKTLAGDASPFSLPFYGRLLSTPPQNGFSTKIQKFFTGPQFYAKNRVLALKIT